MTDDRTAGVRALVRQWRQRAAETFNSVRRIVYTKCANELESLAALSQGDAPQPICVACKSGQHQQCLGGRCECIHEGDAPQPDPLDIEVMRGNLHATFNGGHQTPETIRAFHHGMDTVCNVLAAKQKGEGTNGILLPSPTPEAGTEDPMQEVTSAGLTRGELHRLVDRVDHQACCEQGQHDWGAVAEGLRCRWCRCLLAGADADAIWAEAGTPPLLEQIIEIDEDGKVSGPVPRGPIREAGTPPPLSVDGLRCAITRNPCGTDTWAVGRPCQCAPCQLWLANQPKEAGTPPRQEER